MSIELISYSPVALFCLLLLFIYWEWMLCLVVMSQATPRWNLLRKLSSKPI